jgi:hypothetical protein
MNRECFSVFHKEKVIMNTLTISVIGKGSHFVLADNTGVLHSDRGGSPINGPKLYNTAEEALAAGRAMFVVGSLWNQQAISSVQETEGRFELVLGA